MKSKRLSDDDPLWYKDAIIYQLHVRAFRDSDGDGMGDFRGLIEKLDYLQELGVTAIWVLPFYPSPLKDDGYDIADYTDVHASYGSIADFKILLREAHRRDLRVISELVLNHTSDRHAWFQRARRAKANSRHRDFYVWSDDPNRYSEARIIFKDFETSNWTWDPEAKSYYWHRFYSHQPDLNFDSPAVREEMKKVVDLWLEMGVDGLRLDAVPYLYEREGTNCENLAETHAYLKDLRKHVDQRYADRMLLAEANQWPEDAIAYFGAGDECHTAFHFPVMPRLFMALQMEDRFPVIDILQQTPAIPDVCQWFLFLRNHDELTLEMVTDEERDYMYRVYAHDPQARINLGIRRRLAPLLGNNRRRIELLNGLLMSLPGTPVIYYGDEIGMGDNIYLGDRNGVRTPMQWSTDRNAGFSQANPQQLFLPVIIDPEYHYEAINVETQQHNPHSLLWWMKRLIRLRQRFKAFGRGNIEFLYPDNRKVLAFVRSFQESAVVVVANLSRFSQFAELDLSAFRGIRPVEMFSMSAFPEVRDSNYPLTLGPHAFYWFLLEQSHTKVEAESPEPPILRLSADWEWSSLQRGAPRSRLENILRDVLLRQRWFGGKARTIQTTSIEEIVPLNSDACLVGIRVDYTEGESETYLLLFRFATDLAAQEVLSQRPQAAIARVQFADRDDLTVLYDAFGDESVSEDLLQLIVARRRLKGQSGEIAARQSKAFRELYGEPTEPMRSSVLRGEQSNTSIVFGDRLILKLFRRVEEGINPDLEIGTYLTDKAKFAHVPPVAGWLEYRGHRNSVRTLAVLQGFVSNEGDAWSYTLDNLGRYFERVMAQSAALPDETLLPSESVVRVSDREVPGLVHEMVGSYLADADLLGQRTAELHLSLAVETQNNNFAPEPFTQLFQRSLYQVNRGRTSQVMHLLRRRIDHLPAELREMARQVLGLESQIQDSFRAITKRKISAMRIRCHGDYHLGQVLYTGKDFVIIDFEGEPARALSERRIKRSPLKDVAGMMRSFHYAVHAALRDEYAGGISREPATLERWGAVWRFWTSVVFLKAYRTRIGQSTLLPHRSVELELLLNVCVLEKMVYELNYELNNRPDWVGIPLQAIRELSASLPPPAGSGT